MTTRPIPSDDADQRWQQAALYYAGALTADEAAQFEALLAAGDAEFLAECRGLAEAAAGLVESVPAVSPPESVRHKLLERAAATGAQSGPAPRIPSDSPALEESGIFIRRQRDDDWHDHQVPGIRFRYLYVDPARKTQTVLLRCAPGAKYPQHDHHGPEETFVLEGDLRLGSEILRAGDYQRCEPGSRHLQQWTETGCLLLITAPLE